MKVPCAELGLCFLYHWYFIGNAILGSAHEIMMFGRVNFINTLVSYGTRPAENRSKLPKFQINAVIGNEF